jgi:hypothetical protein
MLKHPVRFLLPASLLACLVVLPLRAGEDVVTAVHGTVTKVDAVAKTIAVKTADGSEETYRLTESAARDAGKDITEGSEKSAKVTIYYTEEAGHKVAHFFKRAI